MAGARPVKPPAPHTVIGKVRLILNALAESGGVLGLSELARRTDLSKATVHRLCGELVAWGVVQRAGDAFRLGSLLFELGSRVPARRLLRDAALHFLEDLSVASGQTVHLAVLDGLDVMYVERLPGRSTREVPSSVASRLPLHCTATGRCLLAFGPAELFEQVVAAGLTQRTARSVGEGDELRRLLDQVRLDGVATEIGEVFAGLMSVGAPVFELGNQLVGAISVTGGIDELDATALTPLVRLAAAGLSRRLGASMPV
ncbi:MAG: IclR family transcriptional regulator [Actinomycetota bacterium]|nr:IclR family transcriptional regulator [Actinomycetota bacterium]